MIPPFFIKDDNYESKKIIASLLALLIFLTPSSTLAEGTEDIYWSIIVDMTDEELEEWPEDFDPELIGFTTKELHDKYYKEHNGVLRLPKSETMLSEYGRTFNDVTPKWVYGFRGEEGAKFSDFHTIVLPSDVNYSTIDFTNTELINLEYGENTKVRYIKLAGTYFAGVDFTNLLDYSNDRATLFYRQFYKLPEGVTESNNYEGREKYLKNLYFANSIIRDFENLPNYRIFKERQGSAYNLNLARLNIVCLDEKGNELEKYSITGLNKYSMKFNKVGIDFTFDDCFSDVILEKQKPTLNDEMTNKYRLDYNVIPEWWEDISFTEAGYTLDKPISEGKFFAATKPEDDSFLYALQQTEDQEIEPIAIEGYKTPENQKVHFGVTEGEADTTFKPEDHGFTLNEEDWVWEKTLTFTYEQTDFTVDFEVDGVAYGEPQTVKKGENATEPEAPTKEGYTFKGWYVKGDEEQKLFNFDTEINENITLVAKFEKVNEEPTEKEFTITYLVDGKAVKTDKVKEGQKATKPSNPEDPTGKKREFLGWYEGDKKFDFSAKVEQDLYLTAKFKEPEVQGPDKTALQSLYDMVKNESKSDYKESTWTPFEKALKEAKSVLDSDKATPDEVKKAQEKLHDAYAGLRSVDDKKSELRVKSIETVKNIEVDKGTKEEDAIKKLPKKIKVKGTDDKDYELDLSWKLYNYKADKPGIYMAKGKYKLPDEFSVAIKDREVTALVTVKDGDTKTEDKKTEDKKDDKITDSSKMLDIRGHWAEPAMNWTLKHGIFKGTTETTFDPDRHITRGELVTLLYRLSGEGPEKYKHTSFKDVGDGIYYDIPIEWARQNNVATGYPDGNFRPNQEIKRDELASFINRFINRQNFKFAGVPMKELKDMDRVAAWAYQDILQMQAYGLVQGYPDGNFHPEYSATRAEMAQILYNMDKLELTRHTILSSGGTVDKTTEDKKTPSKPEDQKPTEIEKPGENEKPSEENKDSQNNTSKLEATISVDIKTLLSGDNMSLLDSDLKEFVPANGYILPPTKVAFENGETAWDLTKRVLDNKNIQLSYEFTPKYNSIYVKSINKIGEFDAGEGSGWMYNVNGKYPDHGVSLYRLKDGDKVEWRYTVSLGEDIGGKF